MKKIFLSLYLGTIFFISLSIAWKNNRVPEMRHQSILLCITICGSIMLISFYFRVGQNSDY